MAGLVKGGTQDAGGEGSVCSDETGTERDSLEAELEGEESIGPTFSVAQSVFTSDGCRGGS